MAVGWSAATPKRKNDISRMKIRDIAEAKSADLRASAAALRRAALMARQIAIQTNTNLIIVKDGKLTASPLKLSVKPTRTMRRCEDLRHAIINGAVAEPPKPRE
jgi:hypothetical protein